MSLLLKAPAVAASLAAVAMMLAVPASAQTNPTFASNAMGTGQQSAAKTEGPAAAARPSTAAQAPTDAGSGSSLMAKAGNNLK